MKTLIKNASVVLPNETAGVGVLIEGNKIVEIDPASHVEVDRVVDANGLYLIPGVVDDQVHFRDPGLTEKEDLEHATRACAKGGVTSFLEMPNTIPNTISQEVLENKLSRASTRCHVNYGFYIGATPDNISELRNATRTPGIKIFIGSSTGDLLVDEQEALERIFAETTLPICAHCEDEQTVRANKQRLADRTDIQVHSEIRNHEAALIATKRSIDLALRHNHPFHVLHVSTADEIEVIQQAGDLITAEVCPHHLFFNVEDYARLGSFVKMNPSIKTADDNRALWQALLDGVIGVIATDHAPHTLQEKQQPYPACPSGLPAVENSLALMLNQVHLGKCTIEQVVQWMSVAPAQVWNINGKGSIAVGQDADLVLVDLTRKQTVRNSNQLTKCGWTPWDGVELTGTVCQTWVMGQLAFELIGDDEYRFADQPLGTELTFGGENEH